MDRQAHQHRPLKNCEKDQEIPWLICSLILHQKRMAPWRDCRQQFSAVVIELRSPTPHSLSNGRQSRGDRVWHWNTKPFFGTPCTTTFTHSVCTRSNVSNPYVVSKTERSQVQSETWLRWWTGKRTSIAHWRIVRMIRKFPYWSVLSFCIERGWHHDGIAVGSLVQ